MTRDRAEREETNEIVRKMEESGGWRSVGCGGNGTGNRLRQKGGGFAGSAL